MVGNPNDNIFVEFDCQNIVLVDPNKTVDLLGNVKERQLKHEELVYYANLECSLFPRTRLAVNANGSYEPKTISIASINFLKPGGKKFLTDEYLDDMTGIDKSRANNQEVQNKTSLLQDEKNPEDYKSNIQHLDTELLGITKISINTKLNLMPEVEIEMEDIRGRALFEKGENSPYAVFFNYPYPLFYLTIKGYLGKAVRYQLALRNFSATFDTDSGNFKIKTSFYAYKYNVLTQLQMDYLLALPYMYKAKYQISPPAQDAGTQSAQLSNGGTDLGKVQVKESSLGLQKMREVYSEYKSKGLIEDDFPEITVQDLLARLEQLETNIINTLSESDLTPLTDASNYKNQLNDYLKDVYTARNSSWFYTYLDTQKYFVSKQGYKIYTFKKEIAQSLDTGAIDNTINKLKVDLIERYNKILNDNKSFGKKGAYVIRNKTITSNVDKTDVKYEDINISSGPKIEDIDFEQTFIERNGKKTYTTQEIQQLRAEFIKISGQGAQINSTTLNIKYEWFRFEGVGSFTEIIETKINSLNSEINKIQAELNKILSDVLTSKDGGLGFQPTIKNLLAVLLASAEGFLRLMCDVHEKAWNVREDRNRVNAILGTDKNVTSPDAKQSVKTTNGNLIPIYPWPQYFAETGNNKGEPYVIAYPGDSKYITQTKGYLYDSWPEIQFVEEFLKGKTTIGKDVKDESSVKNQAQFIDRISFNAIDFPLSNILYSNKSESKFLFEMWERVLLLGGYSRFNKPDAKNDYANALAESEFLNIKEALLPDSYFLLQKLKQYGFNSSNFVGILAHVSSGGLGESWQKYIRDEFATTYIQNEVNDSFRIYDKNTITPGINVITLQPTEFNNVDNYLKTTKSNVFDFTDTFPFCLKDWFKKGLADGNGSNQQGILNTTKVLTVNSERKMVANFTPKTTTKEVRPITNFSLYSVSDPTPQEVNLKSFYQNREIKNQIPTEGNIIYKNYNRNLVSEQTTSILNTPYFVNSIQEGVVNLLTGNTYPFVSSAFLFLNSLPLATLREKYKTYENNNTTDLDYIFSSFKKFGAIHKIPYAWILKYGSVWHRYKTWIEKGVDIIQNSWKDFDTTFNFDPITQNANRIYNLTISGNTNQIGLQNNTTLAGNNVVTMNVGFYPNIINDFSIFCRGYGIFSGYTDSEIQSKLYNPNGGFTLVFNDSSSFKKNPGYDSNNPNEFLSMNTWSCTLIDSGNTKQYIVPSFGSNINQTKEECFKTDGKLYRQVKSNKSVYNGSVRTLWAAPNYGYFDNSEIDIPSPLQYMKMILTGQSQQQSFSLMASNKYTYIDEVFSVFEKNILDLMEEEFLTFSKSMYDYKVLQKDELTTTRVIINQLPVDTESSLRNFQLLMRQVLSTTADTTTTSAEFNNVAKQNQLTNFTNIIQQFLEYDVAVKMANPSGYNRRLFDSYATNKYIEDRIIFDPYNPGVLPNQSGNPTLAQSKTQNPEIWKALQLYVGFSNESGLQYTNTGSYITDFFSEMNIQVSPESIETLAPLIKIYATQKKLDPTFNATKMKNGIDSYINNIDSFTDNVFNLMCQKIQKELPNVKEIVDEKENYKAVEGTQPKVDLWEKFKALNDTFISGYDYTQTTFMEDVLLLDRANRNIGDDVFIDPIKTYNLFKSINNSSSSVYTYIESVLGIHHFICMMHPAYINFYGVQEVSKNNVPRTEGTLDFANNLFGTFLNVDTRASSPKLVCTYAAEPSKYPAADKNENYRFKSDSFDFKCGGDMPLFDNLDGKTDWGQSNKVVGFNVDIGIRNQNIFNHFDVSQDMGKQTAESMRTLDDMIRQYNGKQISTQNVSLWNFYNNRSYTSRVTSLGNAMIQPTMYFNLRYVPMFYGPYYITEVRHDISPGKFNTSFTGIRQQVFALPPLDSYLQTLTKTLFDEIQQQILQQKANKNSANSTTTAATQNTQTTNYNKVLNPQTCVEKMYNGYRPDVKNGYIAVPNQSATTMNITEVVKGIKDNIKGAKYNLELSRMLAFVTIFWNSYNGTYFNCFNNNFCGARLDNQWPDSLSKLFNKQYLCLQSTNGDSIPYAAFDSKVNMFKFLELKWFNENASINPRTITNIILTKFGKSLNYTQAVIEDYVKITEIAMDLAIEARLNN